MAGAFTGFSDLQHGLDQFPVASCRVVPARVIQSAAILQLTHCIGSHVSGLRAGAIANRQLVIYDKRAEVIATGKMGWLKIWNDARAKAGKPPFDLKDRDQSLVWRFELRMGAKQLRNKWEMRSWADLDAMIGDAYSAFCERIRYCIPTGAAIAPDGRSTSSGES